MNQDKLTPGVAVDYIPHFPNIYLINIQFQFSIILLFCYHNSTETYHEDFCDLIVLEECCLIEDLLEFAK